MVGLGVETRLFEEQGAGLSELCFEVPSNPMLMAAVFCFAFPKANNELNQEITGLIPPRDVGLRQRLHFSTGQDLDQHSR